MFFHLLPDASETDPFPFFPLAEDVDELEVRPCSRLLQSGPADSEKLPLPAVQQ